MFDIWVGGDFCNQVVGEYISTDLNWLRMDSRGSIANMVVNLHVP
jgi:hypothetical protein